MIGLVISLSPSPSLPLRHSPSPTLPLPVVRAGCKVHSCLIYQPPSHHRPVQSLATKTDTAPRPKPYPHLLSPFFYSKEAAPINYRLNCPVSPGYEIPWSWVDLGGVKRLTVEGLQGGLHKSDVCESWEPFTASHPQDGCLFSICAQTEIGLLVQFSKLIH